MEKKFMCIKDLQGGEFAVGYSMTVEEWRGQAMEWAENDNTEETIEELENLKENEVIDYIREVWELEIVESNDFAENILFDINEVIEDYKHEYNRELGKLDNVNNINEEMKRIRDIIHGLERTKDLIYNELRKGNK